MAQKKKLAPMPRVTSKTITVGALLGKIKRLILAEPARLNMNAYVAALMGRKVYKNLAKKMPKCGTVACMAGWGAVLLRPDSISGTRIDNLAEGVMSEVLGFEGEHDYLTVAGLFNSEHCEFDTDTYYGSPLPTAGTKEHADVVAKRIDTYLARHPEIVKRKIVVADVQAELLG